MNITRIDAFSIPIFFATFGEVSRTLNKALVDDIFKDMDSRPTEMRSGIDIFQTKTDMESRYDSFNELKTIMDKALKFMAKSIGMPNGTTNTHSFWGNVCESSYGFNMPHSHLVGSLFSGVYFPSSGIEFKDGEYVSVSDEQNLDTPVEIKSTSTPDPGGLILLDPLEFCKSALVDNNCERYPYWGLPYNITPKEGTLVVFPNYLPHMVAPTRKENFTRVSIAFNISM